MAGFGGRAGPETRPADGARRAVRGRTGGRPVPPGERGARRIAWCAADSTGEGARGAPARGEGDPTGGGCAGGPEGACAPLHVRYVQFTDGAWDGENATEDMPNLTAGW